ncbi:5-formyltetrahydrofolate cyclo-ligase [Luteolibacter ambystomatis]|uniref:5-formyltetrahydrofolate cyclo-ligase n=2 Tax=Luteolibacter ambystomatis TaxID=2824561 RepID=A0A975IZB3_9BACT|nr:5-formyltetrahydrofolate cyclo-ligase [Luteolibacter ambystomatis]
MRRRLREIPGDSAVLREAISAWLDAHPEARVIASFAALPGEPDLLPLVAIHPERMWVFPTVRGEHLTFHPVADTAADFEAGSFGIREPAASLPTMPHRDIDVFLCPGLAFTNSGGRLGRGRGFYDRMLALARPDTIKLGVCFPFQITANIFPEPHDVSMSGIIC